MPVTLHVVRSSAGTGGISTANLDTAFTNFGEVLADSGSDMRVFRFGDVDYIDNSFWVNVTGTICDGGANDLGSCSNDSDCPGGGTCRAKAQMLEGVNNDPTTLNIYFAQWNTFCGGGSFTSFVYQGIVMDDGTNCPAITNGDSLTHEFGHFFDLSHTHHDCDGDCPECPDGSNCDTAGDGICDTRAAPNLNGHVDDGPCTWDMLTCDDGSNQGYPCNSDSDCPGGQCTDEGISWCNSCNVTGAECGTDADCEGACSLASTRGCTDSADCAQCSHTGHASGISCTDDDDCAVLGAGWTCEYFGPCIGYAGSCEPQVFYPPLQVDNMMSYAPDACRDTFTPDQVNAMFGTWLSNANRTSLFDRTEYVAGTFPSGGDGRPIFGHQLVADARDEADDGDYIFVASGEYPEAVTFTGPVHLRRWDVGSGSVVIGSASRSAGAFQYQED